MTMMIAEGSLDNFLQLLGAIGVFLFVLVLAYFVTRWIGNYQKVQTKDRNMQIIEGLRVGNNKYIQLVKVADEYLLVGIGKDRVEFLTKLSEENAQKIQLPSDAKTESFQEILKKFKTEKKDKTSKK